MKILFSILFIIFLACVYFLWPTEIAKGQVQIKCHYMAYACGDCYAQYRIDDAYGIDGSIKDKLIHTDIYVQFKSTDIEYALDNATGQCATCYEFLLTGHLQQSRAKGYYFLAEKAQYKLRFKGCCN